MAEDIHTSTPAELARYRKAQARLGFIESMSATVALDLRGMQQYIDPEDRVHAFDLLADLLRAVADPMRFWTALDRRPNGLERVSYEADLRRYHRVMDEAETLHGLRTCRIKTTVTELVDAMQQANLKGDKATTEAYGRLIVRIVRVVVYLACPADIRAVHTGGKDAHERLTRPCIPPPGHPRLRLVR